MNKPVDGVYITDRGLRVAADAVAWAATRSGGPGGQHANTSDTAVTVTIDVAAAGLPPAIAERVIRNAGEVITATSSSSRSQWRNRQLAWAAAVERLDRAATPPPPPRRPTRPSRSARETRLNDKRRASERKVERRRPSADD
jgi:ribosome-associated protein